LKSRTQSTDTRRKTSSKEPLGRPYVLVRNVRLEKDRTPAPAWGGKSYLSEASAQYRRQKSVTRRKIVAKWVNLVFYRR
jgi:hypothetical protein